METIKRWLPLLLGIVALGMVTFLATGGAVLAEPGSEASFGPLAQATATATLTPTATPTATPTRNPSNRVFLPSGDPPVPYRAVANGDGTFSGSVNCTNCGTSSANLQAQGTPLVATSSGALIVTGATPLPTWTPQSVLAVGTPLVATAQGSLNVQGYVVNGASTPEAITGGRAFMTPVTTPVGVANVIGVGVARLTPVALSHGDFTDMQLDGNGSLRTVTGGYTFHVASNPTLTVAASYVSGDYIGTSTTPWSWAACRTTGGTGRLDSVTVVDKAIQSVAGELWLFDRSVTVPNDSAAWTVTDADAQFLIGVVPFGTYYASAANSVASVTGLSMPVWCNGGTSIYGAVVTRGSPSYSSGDVTVVLSGAGD